jgi:glycosyltransferase involved in cell wall biosynthesis
MRIALVHNAYQWPGGEDIIVNQERDLLRSAGHQVLEYRRSNQEIGSSTLLQQITLAQRAVWSSDTFQEFRALLRREKPDLVHVHNTFVMISPSIYWACAEEGLPVVQTLHNFRLLCPQGTFLRNGKICEECVEHSLLRSVAYGCYRGSRLASGAAAALLTSHWWAGTWTHKIDSYIALSHFARNKFVRAGLPSEKLFVKPNFVYPDLSPRTSPGDYGLFVGRITLEKGLPTLLSAWSQVKTDVPLMLVGDGALRESLEAQVAETSRSRIIFRGYLSREETLATIKAAKFLLCASCCYEQAPVTIMEAYACGVPVIAPSLGPLKEVIDDERTGLLFRPGDATHLAEKIQWALNHDECLQTMGKRAREKYETQYGAENNYRKLMEIYERTIAARGRAVQARGPLDEPYRVPPGIASV